jgi:hypothetical protein
MTGVVSKEAQVDLTGRFRRRHGRWLFSKNLSIGFLENCFLNGIINLRVCTPDLNIKSYHWSLQMDIYRENKTSNQKSFEVQQYTAVHDKMHKKTRKK